MRFHLEAYGCTMNHGEGEFLRRMLLCDGHTSTDRDHAEFNILFTCVVIKFTENRMFRRLRELASTGHQVLVSGCLASTLPERIQDIAPEALVVPPKELGNLSTGDIEEWLRSGKRPEIRKVVRRRLPMNKKVLCPAVSAPIKRTTFIVPISGGCLGNCTYCITKKARGKLESYPPEEIEEIVRGAVEAGYREIQITSQDTGIYGRDGGQSLPGLLQRLTRISGDFRIRVGMMNPAGLKSILNELIHAYSSEKIFKFLHLPVQSGDNAILRIMKRRYTVEDFREIVREFRTSFPELVLSTDIIVGFPCEDEAAFQQSIQLIEEIRPELVNITRYSERTGTEAVALPGKVHGRISKERSRLLTGLRFRISAEINSGFVDKEMKVLVTEKGKPGSVICRDDNYRTVVIKEDLPVGEWHTVRIMDTTEVYLMGEII